MLTKNRKNAPARIVAFAVVEHDGQYVPTRLEIEYGEVTKEVPIAPSGPYKPIAYQYLAGRVMEFYNSLQLQAAAKVKS